MIRLLVWLAGYRRKGGLVPMLLGGGYRPSAPAVSPSAHPPSSTND